MAEVIIEHKSSRKIGRTKTKVLCPICTNEQLSLAKQESDSETLTLECNHKRAFSLAPKVNSVGIEETDKSNRKYNVLNRLFPILPDAFSDREWSEYTSSFNVLKA
jgi:hypothetical protein